MKLLRDCWNREFPYLRLSITDACNFRCSYCLPDGNVNINNNNLTLTEIENLLAAFVGLGLQKVRLTGGEPTIRRDLTEIISLVSKFPEIKTRALTTNGYNLAKYAKEWYDAGLNSINVSVDSLNQEKFAKKTGRDILMQVLAGIEQAFMVGFQTVKINVVLLNDIDLTEMSLFLDWIKTRSVSVRFIELMQTNSNHDYFQKNYQSPNFLREYLLKNGWASIEQNSNVAGPAKEYTHGDYQGKIGVISAYSKGFCDNCNKLRVSSSGDLYLCLFGDSTFSLRPFLQNSQHKIKLQTTIIEQLKYKKRSHFLEQHDFGTINSFADIGG